MNLYTKYVHLLEIEVCIYLHNMQYVYLHM